MSTAAGQSLTAFVARYLESLAVNNYAELTQYTYKLHLDRFVAWCAERGVTRPVEVTKATIESYQKWLFHFRRENGRALNRKTQNGRVHAVIVFFRWLAKRGHLLHDPGATIEMPRAERTLPRPALTIAEIERVLNSIDLADPLGIRDRAILETLYSTAIRRFELAKLKIADLDADRGTLVVHGKGKKDRVVPIGERAIRWIAKYVDEVRPLFAPDSDDGFLFLTRFGTPMTPAIITQMGTRRMRASGVKKAGACHSFGTRARR